MYAVFQFLGFQYTAEEGATVRVPYHDAENGSKLDINEVLLIKNDDKDLVGTPFVSDAKIEAEIVGSGKADKVLVHKYKRRTKYRLTQGHRQKYTDIKINRIIVPAS